MEKMNLTPETEQRLRKVAADIRTLADSIQALCTQITDGVKENVPEPEITLEQVRGVLAEKSREGHTEAIRTIIQKYGADCLSGVDPKDYPEILRETEVLT